DDVLLHRLLARRVHRRRRRLAVVAAEPRRRPREGHGVRDLPAAHRGVRHGSDDLAVAARQRPRGVVGQAHVGLHPPRLRRGAGRDLHLRPRRDGSWRDGRGGRRARRVDHRGRRPGGPVRRRGAPRRGLGAARAGDPRLGGSAAPAAAGAEAGGGGAQPRAGLQQVHRRDV
ncbi:MAG: Dihydrofolate reductase, partial [uncultured Nocardioides sp.]